MTTALVLDDRASDRDLIATVLRYAGFEVVETAGGEDALAQARRDRPDLVVADLLMPGMNGYEFVRALRADERTAQTPVIFCTAVYAAGEAERLAEACGVSHILMKPCEPGEIIRVVGEILGSTPELTPLVPVEQFDREQLRVLNDKLVQKVDELEVLDGEHVGLHEHLRRAERQMAESLTLLETLLLSAPVGFGYVDRDYVYRRVNDTLAEINGAPVEAHFGRTVAEVVPDLWPQIESSYRHVLEDGEAVVSMPFAGETAGAPGEIRHWLVSLYPVRLETETIGVGIVVVDVTERDQAAELRSIVMETMAEGLCVVDAEGRLMMMNSSASEMLGWSEDELRGKPMHAVAHYQRADGSAFPESECELHTVHALGRSIRASDDAFTRKDGSIFPVSYSARPLLSGVTSRGAVIVFRDATEEKAEQARVRRELDAFTWVGRTRDAIDDQRLVLYSQPIVAIDGTPHSEELLLRMIGRDGLVIMPGAFLPVAEKFGLIAEIDRWVIKQAIALAGTGRRVEANLSADSIGNLDLLPLIEHELRECGADPGNVVFEITETALMGDIGNGESFARGLAEMGCGLALDDFGTGFGSFTYLKALPIQYLKIDIDFVRDLASNRANQHLVKAIVGLAEGFGHRTIAEGVEDAETLDLLGGYGVDFAQGYHLGRPAPIEPR